MEHRRCPCGARLQTPKATQCRACHRAYMREWRRRNPLTDEQRHAGNARAYANQYLRRGKIERRPCLDCGAAPAQMHHPDLSYPLRVVWLCPDHHRREHRRTKKRRFQEKDFAHVSARRPNRRLIAA